MGDFFKKSEYKKRYLLIVDMFAYLIIFIIMYFDIYSDEGSSYFFSPIMLSLSAIALGCGSKIKGINDELTGHVMSKVNNICIKCMIPVLLVIAILVSDRSSSLIFSPKESTGLVIIGAIFIFTILRLVLFEYYQRKGIYNKLSIKDNKVKDYREKYLMKQNELAQLVGVNHETIAHLENGKYDPSLKLAIDISKVFDVTIEDLFVCLDK